MSTSTSPSWRASPAAAASHGAGPGGPRSGAQVLRPAGLEGPPPDESIWSGPMLGFLAAVVVAVPIISVVLMLTSFGVLQDTSDSSASTIANVVSEATESLDTVLDVAEPATVAVVPETPDVAAADEAVDPAPQMGQVYVVVAGDVLHQIALRFAVTTEALAAYNALTNPNALRIGQELRVPPPGYQPPAPEDLDTADGAVPDFPTGPLTPRG